MVRLEKDCQNINYSLFKTNLWNIEHVECCLQIFVNNKKLLFYPSIMISSFKIIEYVER